MIMRPGQPLLLPASPFFIWFTLLLAMMVNMLPVGRVPWMPDVLAVVIVFWSVHQPLRVGVIAAFLFGLAVDVHQASLLGQHALAYTTLSYFAITIHRRLLCSRCRRRRCRCCRCSPPPTRSSWPSGCWPAAPIRARCSCWRPWWKPHSGRS